MTLLIAGYETTAIALSWTWYLLSQHPHVEQRLHAELETVLGGQTPAVDIKSFGKVMFCCDVHIPRAVLP